MKPFVKLDGWEWAAFMIASIFIPPLFIVNLIIFLCQTIPRAIKNRQEQKEIDEYNNFVIQSEIHNNKSFSIDENDKKIVDEKLNILKQSYLGQDAEVIANFQFNLLNNNLTNNNVHDFVNFLIELYDMVPQEVLNLLPDANPLCTNEINNCIEILQDNLD